MFRLNGIYKAQNMGVPFSEVKPYIRTYSEYVTQSGEKIEDVIFDEYGYSKDFDGDGYYRITEILDEHPVLDGLNAINHYEANLRLEKVADGDWLQNENAEEFFNKLKELGFYVESRLVNKNSEHSEKTEWFDIDTVRGIIVKGSLGTGDNDWLFVDFEFIFPQPSFAREMLNYESETMGGFTKHFGFGIKNELRNIPSELPNSIKLHYFAPDIFDIIRKKVPLNNHREKFTNFLMPFVAAMEYEWRGYCEFGSMQHPIHNAWPYPQGEYMVYFENCRKIYEGFPQNVQEFLLQHTDVEKRYLKGKPWKKFINPQSKPPKNTDYRLCVKIVGVGKEGEEIAKDFMPIFDNFSEIDAKFLTFTEEMEEYIKNYDEEKKKDTPFGPAGKGMFTPLERERDPILELFQGADLAIMFMPNTDDASVQKARFLSQTANIVGVMNMVVSDKISDNVLTDNGKDSEGKALIEHTSAYILADNDNLTTSEAMTQSAKSILSICLKENCNSETDKLTNFSQMRHRLSMTIQNKPIYSAIVRSNGEKRIADAADDAVKKLREHMDVARVEDAFLHIETGSKTDSRMSMLEQGIEKIRERFAEYVKMISCISVDTTLGEDVRFNLMVRFPADKGFDRVVYKI